MINKTKSLFFCVVLIMILSTSFQAEAGLGVFGLTDSFSAINLDNRFSLITSKTISIKKGEKYDESKDPALRKGTENTEQPQGSFFAIPAVVLGIIGLALFFNRDKG